MHDLRHSFASAMVNSGMTLYDVKQILGHSNIKTTQRYAHLSNERLKTAASSVVDYFESPSVLVLGLKPTDLSENLADALSHAPKVATALRQSLKGQK
jgi:pyrroline-5-carboxylate reductase